MKRLVIIFLTLLLSANFLFAEEGEKNAKKVSTLIIMKHDWLKPQDSEGFSSYTTSLYWNYDKWLGFGLDATSRPKFDYLELKPYATVNKGPYYLLAGFATDNSGGDYFQAGFWYYNLHLDKKLEVYLDFRNYRAMSGKASSYTDNYIETSYLIGDFAVGPVAFYDHWWNKDLDIVSLGAIAYYKKSKSFIPYIRYMHDWSNNGSNTSELDRFRVGLKICF